MAVPQLEKHVNNFQTTLGAAITGTPTAATLTTTAGLPSTGKFRLLVDSEVIVATREGASAGQVVIVRRAGDSTTSADHSNGATATVVETARGMEAIVGAYAAGPTLPKEHGLSAWNFHHTLASSTNKAGTTNTILAVRVPVYEQLLVENINFLVASAGVTGSGTNVFVLWDSSGTLLGQTGDMTATLTTTGLRTGALVTPVTVTGGPMGDNNYVIAGVLIGTWTTYPTFRQANSTTFNNIGIATALASLGQTQATSTVPNPLAPTASNNIIWAALS